MLPMKLMFAATVAAVRGEPSEQVTPLRMVYVALVVVPDHFVASPGSGAPAGVKLISESRMRMRGRPRCRRNSRRSNRRRR
jgi:hypothetical protein